jgi:hypothetical protein
MRRGEGQASTFVDGEEDRFLLFLSSSLGLGLLDLLLIFRKSE